VREHSGLDTWVADVTAALGISALSPAERQALLDSARQVAHGVYRPAAPVTAYLVGVAVGRGTQPQAAVATISRLVAQWLPPQRPQDEEVAAE
jgi:hypothetical protein